MKTPLLLLIAIACLLIAASSTEVSQSTNSYLTLADKARFKKLLDPGLKLLDVPGVHYAVLGYKYLGETLPNKQEICGYLMKVMKDGSNMTTEEAFQIANTWKAIGSCKSSTTLNIFKVLMAAVDKESSSLAELYYAINGLIALSEKIPRDKVDKIAKTVQSVLRKDDNLWNLGYTFHIAADLESTGLSGGAFSFAFDRIEDAIVQADEVNGQYLQFEGGASLTSYLVNGILKLSSALKKKPNLTSSQIVKMANYLLSRRSVQRPKGIQYLLSALIAVANNPFEKPVCITLAEGGISVSAKQPLVTIKVCDVLGNPLNNAGPVVANTATRIGDDAVILMKEPLLPIASDKTLFTLNLMDKKPEKGFYKITVTAGSVTNTVSVKVLCEVTVDYLEIGIGDADQTTQPKLTRVAYPEKLAAKVEADSQQKLVMRFLLKDVATKKAMRTHQAFVRLSPIAEPATSKRAREVIFFVEPDASHIYKFDMPVGSAATNFGHQSGEYNVEVIIGDAVLSNPFQWTVATVSLKFAEPASAEAAASSAAKQKADIYSSKPEIKHMFRQPEKRPSAFVSNLFSGLCLAPVLLLLILWAKLGVNISNFPFSISAVAFHLGLGSIFVLFGIFWLKLNMFVTLKYLLGLGVVTFLAGNKMLSSIAHKHKMSR